MALRTDQESRYRKVLELPALARFYQDNESSKMIYEVIVEGDMLTDGILRREWENWAIDHPENEER